MERKPRRIKKEREVRSKKYKLSAAVIELKRKERNKRRNLFKRLLRM